MEDFVGPWRTQGTQAVLGGYKSRILPFKRNMFRAHIHCRKRECAVSKRTRGYVRTSVPRSTANGMLLSPWVLSRSFHVFSRSIQIALGHLGSPQVRPCSFRSPLALVPISSSLSHLRVGPPRYPLGPVRSLQVSPCRPRVPHGPP